MRMQWKNRLANAGNFCKEHCTKHKGHTRLLIWAALLVVLGISFCAFFYGDIEATFDNTVLLAKAMKEGEFLHFYEYSLEHAQTYWPAGYDILLYLFFAIWNLPAILLHLLTGFAYLESPLALLWCKGITVVFAAGMAWILYRIARLLQLEKAEGILAAFLMLSSLSLAAPVFMVGQYDTLPLFFMLLGLYFYLKEKPYAFYLCFLISIPLKIYGLFLLLPLILLKEKKIGRILVKTAGCCSLYLVLKLLFAGDSAYPFISGSQGAYGMAKLVNAGVDYSGYSLCLFVGAYAAVCIFCYWKKLASAREKLIYPVYICFLVFAAFVTLVAINDYWIIFYLPFAVLLMVANRRNYKINVLIETVSSGMYLLYAFTAKVYPYSYPELVTERFMAFFMKIPDECLRLYESVKNMLECWGIAPYAQVFHTLFVVGMLCLLVINRPGAVIKGAEPEPEEENPPYEEQGILWSRVLLLLAAVIILIYANLKSGNPVLYTTLEDDHIQGKENLEEGAVFIQDMKFEDAGELSELTLYFSNDGYVKDNFGSVWIRITEKETGRLLFEKRLGASMTAPGKPCRISLPGIDVEDQRTYTLCLEGMAGTGEGEYFFSPWLTGKPEEGQPVMVNGEYEDQSLYMQIR